MEKNENGIPVRTPRSDQNAGGTTAPGAKTERQMTARDGECGIGGMLPEGEVSLAYVYCPMQKFCMLYTDSEALNHGTLFEQLYKPKEVYRSE